MKNFLKIVSIAVCLFILPVTTGTVFGQDKEDCSKLAFVDYSSRKPRTDLPFEISEMRRLRPEDICKKKEGWFPTGLPLLNSDPNVGVGYGIRVFLINNGKKSDPFFEYTPYRFRMFAQYFNTTKNRQYQDVSFDAPYVFDSQWRLRGDLIYDTNPNTLYYGIGEKSLQPLSYQERNQPGGEIVRNSTYHSREQNIYFTRPGGPGDPVEFQGNSYSGLPANDAFRVTDRMYNRYDIRSPQANMSGERNFFGGLVRMVAGVRVSQNIIKTFDGQFVKSTDPLTEGTPFSNSGMAPTGKTKVTEDAEAGKIIGANGGNVNSVRFGLVLDTRDLEPDPNRGIFVEATYEKVAKALGSDFQYSKYFTQMKFFYSPFPKVFDKLVIAGRGAFGMTDGDAPFFEYRNLWSTEGGITGLGGLRTLRGYKQDRFSGKAMGWGNLELRWKFFDFNVAGQHFALNLVPFVDFGRVWDDEHNVGLKDYKYSRGLGFRIAWNQSTILMLDYAVSKEDKQIFMNFNHIF
ncbi:Omp85 family outer membrane protein [Leptospira adleri]|uniref:Peptide-binding protein n=1 Tax=Leptospira adleri TaxID=2023186 RepID=A0A2M9YPU2_9LEPT|nr:DUF5982 domain-containing protein [Leptospira adleri]PJZ53551.1 peptide-binding protein [Leptospira adleri]PJZ63073.1 peptide-binding protein [Leptospira adleri]